MLDVMEESVRMAETRIARMGRLTYLAQEIEARYGIYSIIMLYDKGF
jgi:hypothetical protein